jgi:hypothetical protein
MSGLRRILTPYDVGLAIAVLIAGLASVYWVGHASAGGAGILRVEIDGRTVKEVTFQASDPPRLVEVRAPRGTVTVELRDGKARVLPLSETVCPLGICWRSGWTAHPAKPIVCLPNRLVVRVLVRPGAVDGITR